MYTPPPVLHRATSTPLSPSRGQENHHDQTRLALSESPSSFSSIFDRRRNLNSPSTPRPSPWTLSIPSTPSTPRPSPRIFKSPSTLPPRPHPRLEFLSTVVEDKTGAIGSPQIDHLRRPTVVDCASQTAIGSPQIDRHRRSTVVDCASQTAIESPHSDHLRRSTVVDCAIQTAVDSDSSSTSSEEFDLLQAENVLLKAIVERETDQVESLKQRNQSLTANFSAKETELDKSKQELQRKTKKKEQVLSHIGQLEDSLNEDGQAREQLKTAAREHRIELNKAKSQIFRSGRKEAEENSLIKLLQEDNKKLLREKATLRGKVRDLEKNAKLAVEWKEKGYARINDIAKANKNLQSRISDRNEDNIALCKRVEELATSYAKIDETLGDLNAMLKESEGIDVRWHTRFDELVTAHRDLGQALNTSPPGSMKSTANNRSLEEIGSNSRRKRRSNSMPPSSSTASTRRAAISVHRLDESPVWPAEYPRFSPSRAEMARMFRRSLDGDPRGILALFLDSPPIPIIRYGSASVQPPEKSLSRELEEIGERLGDPLCDADVDAELQDREESDASVQQQRPPTAVEQPEKLVDERQSNSTDETRTKSADESYTSSTDESDTYLIHERPANLHRRTEERVKQAGRVLLALNNMGLLPYPSFSKNRKLPNPRYPAIHNLSKQPGRDTFNDQPRTPTPVNQAVVSTDQHLANSADELHSYSIETAEVTGAGASDRTGSPKTVPSATMSISIEPQLPADSGQLPLASMGTTDQLTPLSKTIPIPSPPSPVLTAPQTDRPISRQTLLANMGVAEQLLHLLEATIIPLPLSPVLATARVDQSDSHLLPLATVDTTAQLPPASKNAVSPLPRRPVLTKSRSDQPLTLEDLWPEPNSLRKRKERRTTLALILQQSGYYEPIPENIPEQSAKRKRRRKVPKHLDRIAEPNFTVSRSEVPWTATILPPGSFAQKKGKGRLSSSKEHDLHAHQRTSSRGRSSRPTGRSLGDGKSTPGLNNGSSSSKKPSRLAKLDLFSPVDKRTDSSNYELILSTMSGQDKGHIGVPLVKKTSKMTGQDETCTKMPLLQQPSIRIKLPPMQKSSKAQPADQPIEIAPAHLVSPAPNRHRDTVEDASEPDSDLLMISHNVRGQNQEANSTSEPPKPAVDPFYMTATVSTPEPETGDESETGDEPVEDDLLHIADVLDMEMDEHKTLSVLVMLEVLEQNPDETWLARLQATSVTLESGLERKEAIRNMFEEAITQLMEMAGELPEMEPLPVAEDVDAASDSQAQKNPVPQVSGPERREAIRKMFEYAHSDINAMESYESPFSPTKTSSSHSDSEDGEPALHNGTAPSEHDSDSALAVIPVRHVLGPSHLAGALRYHVRNFVASSDPRRWEMTFHPGSLALTPASDPTPPERSRVDDGHIVDQIEELQEDEIALHTGFHSVGQSTEMLGHRQEQEQPLSSPILTADCVQQWPPGAEPQRAELQASALIETSRHVAVMGLVLGFLHRIISIPVGILNWLYGVARDNQWQTLSWLMLLIAWMIVCDRAQMWFDANNSEYRNDQVRMYYQETWGHPGLEKLTFRVVQWLDLTHEVYGHRLYGP